MNQINTTRQYIAIDGVSTLTNIAKRTNAEWVKINGEWVLVSEDIGSEVVVTPTLTEGTEIGEIEVSGNSKKLYAPTPQNVSITQTQTSGTEIATINISDTSTKLYAPTTTVTQTLTSGTEIGEVNGTKLYAPSGGGGGGGEVKRSIDWDNKVDITLPYTATADGYFCFRIYKGRCQFTINGVNIISCAEFDNDVSASEIYPTPKLESIITFSCPCVSLPII
jgi:hypothetical protein